ncbi:hypothetical protein KPB2_5561 [Klebsiella pneumoniae Kb677]|nr:hypothetical protein KPB2_5561 [Klebsiella pneumoniae Kb677]
MKNHGDGDGTDAVLLSETKMDFSKVGNILVVTENSKEVFSFTSDQNEMNVGYQRDFSETIIVMVVMVAIICDGVVLYLINEIKSVLLEKLIAKLKNNTKQ